MVDTLRRSFVLGSGGALGAAALAAPALAAPRPTAKDLTLLSTYVSGTAYGGAADVVQRLRAGDRLVLRRAPENAYDPRTVEVWTADGRKLGHVPRIDNQALSNLMDAGFQPAARVRSVALNPVRPEIRFEVTMTLA